MQTDTSDQAPAATPPQTENSAPPESSDISSLRSFRERAGASSAPAKVAPSEGAASPGQAAGADNREQFIPRTRFDEVLQERNAAQAQLQQAISLMQQQQAQGHQYAPMTPSGMQGAQAVQPTPSAVPDFNDASVQKAWREKIASNPVTGLKEFVSLLIKAEGEPLLNQHQQSILAQLAPIKQTFVAQQVANYENAQAQADPSFAQVKDSFRTLVSQAVNQGYVLDTRTLQAIEGIARAQAGVPLGYAPSAPAPTFSERPGGAGGFGQPATPELTPQQRAVARRFNMSDADYANFLTSNGVSRG